jgi:hypothetical protein
MIAFPFLRHARDDIENGRFQHIVIPEGKHIGVH